MDTKNEIARLINQGRNLRTQASQRISPWIHSKEAQFLGNFFLKTTVEHGDKGLLRKAGGVIQKTDKENIQNEWRNRGNAFLSECISVVGQMSINAKNLTISGNSRKLIQKFNRVRKIKNPVKFFDAVLVVLEEIQNLDLIWNRNIPQELTQRKEIMEKEKQEKVNLRERSKDITKIARTVDLFDRLSISNQLKNYPHIKTSILGALDRVQANDPDSERHCINSCRVAIESLCMEMGKNRDWKTALKNIFPSETDFRQVKNVWNYLSNKGAHGFHNPTKKEAEYCLQSTIATLNFIINKGAVN